MWKCNFEKYTTAECIQEREMKILYNYQMEGLFILFAITLTTKYAGMTKSCIEIIQLFVFLTTLHVTGN